MRFLIRSMLFAVLFTAAVLCEAQEPVNLEGQTAEVNASTPLDQATSNENGENDRAGQTDYPRALPITVSPDGSLLALVTKEGQLQVQNLKRNQIKFKADSGKVTALAYSPDGKTLASCGDSLVLWDTETFEKKQEIEDDVRFFWTVDFSPDGETIATTTMLDPFIKLWGVNGELIHTLHADNKKGFYYAYFLSHSRELISAARDGSIRKWMIPVTAAK